MKDSKSKKPRPIRQLSELSRVLAKALLIAPPRLLGIS